MSAFYSLHTHSRYSGNDALPQVADMVDVAADLGYPALGLTDHGTPAGLVQLYQACKKRDLKPLPGVELYLTPDHGMREQRSHHLTVAAYTETGYRNLVRLTTLATRNFFHRPRVDLADLAQLSEDGHTQGLAVATGCRSGLVTRTMLRDPHAGRRLIETLAIWFPRCYVEVMNHGIDADGVLDDEIVAGLVDIADTAGLPLIVTADSHYLRCEDRELHDWLKELVSFSEDPADGRFSGDGYHLVDTDWLRAYLEPDVLARGLEGLADLAAAAKVKIPELDTFTIKVPDVTISGEADTELVDRVWAKLETRTLKVGKKTVLMTEQPTYLQRVAAELDIIKASGMAGYLLLVASLCDYMREQGIWYYVRGSVSGSLVCLLLGISQDDPIAHDIRMDRFLSGDRTSMPDVDLDIDASRRDDVVAELRRRHATQQVCTYGVYRLEEDDDGDQKGSLRVRYFAVQRKRRKVATDEKVPDEDWAKLRRLSDLKLIKQTGTHAAGFLVAPSQADLDSLPQARIDSTGNLVTAYDKDDLEPFGYPKIDLLGSKTLHGIRIACELVVPDDPYGFLTGIPLDDPKVLRLAGSGNTVGMFQLEGWAQRKGCQDLKPEKTADLIAAQALFRPGVSNEFLATYMRRRKGLEPVPAMHPHLAAELAESYGIAIFQEQVVGVLRRIDMPAAELTAMLKAVKASGKNGIEKAKVAVAEAMPRVLELARAHDYSGDDLAFIEKALTEYAAGYSFGKAHSVRYGMVAYITAWLRVREPLAFWTGMLTAYTGHKDQKKRDVELLYRNAARADGLTLLPPHVNHSAVDYQVEGDAIRVGLVSAKYVGRTAAEEVVKHAPYEHARQIGERCAAGKVRGARKLATGDHPKDCGDTTTVFALWREGAMKGLPLGAGADECTPVDTQEVLTFA